VNTGLFDSPPIPGETTEDRVARELEAMAYHPEEGEEVAGSSKGIDPRGGAKRFKASDHNLRTRDLLEAEGWMMCRADQQRVDYRQMVYRLDFLGLFDWLAFRQGSFRGVQICAKSSIGTHVTEMTSSKKTTFNNLTKRQNLDRWLAEGGSIELIGWEKEGRFWVPTRRLLTPEIIAKVDSRRRS